MFRRHFVKRLALGSAASFSGTGMIQAVEKKTVTYCVKGFTCITCAVGLETILRKQKGVLRAEASYPKQTVVIDFDAAVVTEKSLKACIGEMGFTVS